MVAILSRMVAGFIGLLTRDPQAAVVETRFITSTGTVPTGYGQFTIDDASGNVAAFPSGGTASPDHRLMLIRSFPSPEASPTPLARRLRLREMRSISLRAGYGSCGLPIWYAEP